MRGHIEKRGNKYSFVIEDGKDPVTKKRRQKRYSGFYKKKEVETALTTELEKRHKGAHFELTDQTIEQFMNEWLDYAESRVEYSTYNYYRGYVENRINPIIGHNKVIDMLPEDFEEFYDYLDEEVSRQTIHHIHSILVNAFNYGINHAKIAINTASASKPPKVKKNEMDYWTPEEVTAFLESAKDDQYYIAYLIALTTGMRQGEILGLKWSDVDLDKKVIHVQHNLKKKDSDFEVANLKTNSSYRNITLPEETVNALIAHREAQGEQKKKKGSIYQENDFVVATSLGTFVKPTNLGRSWRAAVKDSGVKYIRFHDTRHTHASLLFRQGVHPKIVQERLGHSSIQVTLDRYSHFLPNMQEEIAKKFDEFMFKKEDKNENKQSLSQSKGDQSVTDQDNLSNKEPSK